MVKNKFPLRVPQKISIVVFALLLVGGAALVFWSSKFKGVEAIWFDDTFAYRTAYTIANTGSAVTNQKVKFTIDTATLITAGKMQSDCDDSRWTDINGKQLKYYIDATVGACNTSTTAFYVVLPSISGTVSLYHYYGNPSAASAKASYTFPPSLSDTMKAYWKLEEASSTRIDSFGANNLSPSGVVTQATGKIGAGQNFSISSISDLNIADNTNLSAGNSDFSTAGWVYLVKNGSNDQEILGKFGSTANHEYFLRYDGGTTRFSFCWYTDAVGGVACVNANNFGNPSTATWFFITAYHDASSNTIGISVNNGTANTASATGGNDGTASFELGSFTGVASRDWGGTLDEMGIWKSSAGGGAVLTAAQKTALYNSGNGVTYDTGMSLTFVPNSGPTANSEEKAPGPLGYWDFDEGTGTLAKDKTASGNNGTLTNMAAPAIPSSGWQSEDNCISSKCLGFDGTNDYVTYGNPTNLQITDAITLGAWVKFNAIPSGATVYCLICKVDGGGYGIIANELASGKLETYFYVGGSYRLAGINLSTLTANKWYYVSATFDGSTTKFYLDGQLRDSVSAAGTISNPASVNLLIGANPSTGGAIDGEYFNGFIDEPKIYNYTRSAAQIKSDFNSKAAALAKGSSAILGAQSNDGLNNGLIGYWKMDESSWNGTAAEVKDSSGNGANGAARNSATTGPGKFGNAGSFAGSNQNANIPVQMINSTNPSFTYSMWVKALNTGAAVQDIVAQARAGTDNNASYEVTYAPSGYGIGITDGSGATQNSFAYNLSSWTHLVVVNDYPNNTYKLFINGSLVKTGAAVGLPSQPLGAQFKIGDHPYTPYGRGFSGSIDDVRVFNRALSPIEAQGLYNFAPGPVAYYNFDAGQGTSVADSSTYGNNGTWTGTAPYWTNGKFGKAGSFNGVDNYVGTGGTTLLSNLSAMTASGWVNVGTYASQRAVISNFSGQPNYQGFLLETGLSSNDVLIAVGSTGGTNQYATTSTAMYTPGRWHYWTAVFDGSQTGNSNRLRFFIDGIQKTLSFTGTIPSTISTSANSLKIGASLDGDTTRYFPGSIDDVKIYNYARTADQIREDMLGRFSPIGGALESTGKSTVGYWAFDEGFGTTTKDQSGLGNSGTLTSMASPATVASGWNQNGKIQKALSFDGTNDFIDLGDGDLITGKTMTVSAWIKSSGTIDQYEQIAGKNYNAFSWALQGHTTQNKIRFFVSASTYADAAVSNSTLNDGLWHHLVGVYDGNLPSANIKLYVDGQQQIVTANQTINVPSTADRESIGAGVSSAGVGGFFFPGLIDEVKIYNFAFTPSEVQTEFNQGAALVLGAVSDTSQLSGGAIASNSANAVYCVPGDSTSCASPVAEWNFNEGTGTSVNDSSGSNNVGTFTSGSWASGKFGKAGNFNGTSSYVTASVPSGITNSNSVSVWIYPTLNNSNHRHITSFGGSPSHFDIRTYGGVLYVETPGLSFTPLSVGIVTNQWVHIEFTYDGATVRLYKNGILVASNVATGTITVGSQLFIGGRAGPQEFFTGKIDQVRVFNYARTPAQVAWDYNQGKPVAQWDFDECQGSVANDSSGSNMGTITIGASGTQTTVGTCVSSNTAAAWWNGKTGKYSASLNFDGTDDYINLTSLGGLTKNKAQVTLSYWVKLTTLPNSGQHFIPFIETNANVGYTKFSSSILNDGSVRLAWRDTATGTVYILTTDTNAISSGGWYHVVNVVNTDTDQQAIYINGTLRRNAANVTAAVYNDTPVYAAISGKPDSSWTTTDYLNGQLDDMRIYNYGLTAAQVKLLYNQSSGVRFGPTTGNP